MARTSPITTPALAPFVGRSAELGALCRAIDSGRLITLLGPPGVGKSRLAREASATLARPVVTWPLGDSADIDVALLGLADELGLVAPIEPMRLTRELGLAIDRLDRAILLIDDAEALIAPLAPVVEQLLAWAPRMTVVVTARRPVGLPTEQRFELGPLSNEDGVALFEARASAASRHVRTDPHSAAIVATLVERLDGLPLAIELCAGRSGVLDPAGMLASLGDRFAVLRGTAGGRHGSLHDALESAWRDLPPPARATLAELAALRGWFVADEAADVVTAVHDLAAHLALLGEHGWLHVEAAHGTRRLCLLESVREFATRTHADPAATEAARTRLVIGMLTRAESAARAIAERGDPAALAYLARAHGNLAAAHAHASARADHDAAVRLLVAMDARYPEGGRPHLHVALLERAPALHGLSPRTAALALLARAAARIFAGRVAEADDDLVAATRLAQTSVDLLDLEVEAELAAAESALQRLHPEEAERALTGLDVPGRASEAQRIRLLRLRAQIAGQRRDTAHALTQIEEAIGQARRLGHPLLELAALQARVSLRLDAAELTGAQFALHAFAEKLADLALPRMTARVLELFGFLALLRGRGDEALPHYEQALAAFEGLGDWKAVSCHAGLAASYMMSGRPAAALHALERAPSSDVPEAHLELLVARAVARARLGDLAGARRDLSAIDRDAAAALGRTVTMAGALVDLAEAVTLRAAGRPERASVLFARVAAARGGDERVWPDTAWMLAREVDRELAAWGAAPDAGAEPGVVVAEDGSWFEAGGRRVLLADKPLLRRLLGALAQLRREDRVDVPGLFEAGWAGEAARPDSQQNRVWVAVARLRALGLRRAIAHDGHGYFLTARVVREDAG